MFPGAHDTIAGRLTFVVFCVNASWKSLEEQMLLLRRVGAYALDIIGLFVLLAPSGQVLLWLGGTIPNSGPTIAQTILWNFSLPVWLYFIISDASAPGATIGKRLLGITVSRMDGTRLIWHQALLRTTVKLLPWELVHIAAFALSTDLTRFRPAQMVGVAFANLLIVVYLLLAGFSRGQRSLHEYVAGTMVRSAHQPGRSRR
jgi:uncharacterized RDD family membrane protein YckC